MTSAGSGLAAPRGEGRRGIWRWYSVAAALVLTVAGPASAQVLPDTTQVPPDTAQVLPDTADVIPDTVRVEPLPPDSTPVGPLPGDSLVPDPIAPDTPQVAPEDSLRQVADTAGMVVDSAGETPDSLIFHELPAIPGGAAAGWERGVWIWSREDLVGTRALTLSELLADVPGIVAVRGGDYGAPVAASAYGLGGGRVRVFYDGYEILALDAGVPDLSHVGLAGLENVRLERGLGGLRIELTSYRIDDPRPTSGVHAGTGDLSTNLLQGTFIHPRALGGSLGLGLERLDTGGSRAAEPGARTGGWLRYTLHRGDDAGLRVELRSATNDFNSARDTVSYPPDYSRRELVFRGRMRVAEGLVAEGFAGTSSVKGGGDGLTPVDASRRQYGLRAGYERDEWWADGAYRLFSGPDLPSSTLDLEAGTVVRELVGIRGRVTRDTWAGRSATMKSVGAWTEPLYGVSAFASWEDGSSGSAITAARVPVPVEEEPEEPEPGGGEEQPEPEEPGPTHRFTQRTGVRVGLAARVGPLDVEAARLSFEVDSLIPLGFMGDRGGVATPGGRFTGFELRTQLRFPLDGWSLNGSITQFDRGTVYLPERAYEGSLRYHGLPMESSENLEIWIAAGVQGRDPMLTALPGGEGTPPPGLSEVPFEQSWFAYFQIRIVTVRAFFRFENLSVRQSNQDLPGRLLPQFRAMYGIRWILWN